jgi:hypothetical protein
MPGQVAGVTKCISGNPIKNNSQTIVHGGTPTDGFTNALDSNELISTKPFYGSLLTHSVSTASSGNIGAGRSNTGAVFAYRDNSSWIISKVTTTLAGSANTLTQSMAASTPSRRPIARFYGYTRYHLTAHDIHGRVTKGAGAGTTILASGLNGVTGFYADHANPRPGVPAELTFMTGNINPSGMTYSVPTNP